MGQLTPGQISTSAREAGGRDAPCLLILVHGTWGRRSTWVEEDSPFCRSLRRLWGSTLALDRSFKRSGWNDFRSRQAAADAFGAHVLDLRARFPEATLFACAHSHGGAVVAHAMRDRSVEAALSGVVCVSTPFIHVTRVNVRAHLPLKITFIAMYVLGLLTLGYALISALARVPGSVAFPLLVVAFACLLLGSAVAFDKLVASHRRMVIRFCRQANTPDIGHGKLLAVRTPGDEALGLLSMVAFFSWLCGATTQRFADLAIAVASSRPLLLLSRLASTAFSQRGMLLVVIPLGVVIVALALLNDAISARVEASAYAMYDGLSRTAATGAFVLLAIPVIVLFALGLAILLATAAAMAMASLSLMAFYDWRRAGLLLVAPWVSVSAESTPSGTHPVVMLKDARRDSRSLSHCAVFDHPALATCVAEYVASRGRR
jgi:hypothetical protein